MQKIIDQILSTFKDVKTRLIVLCSITIIYILWNEWRIDYKLSDEFIKEQLRECKETNKRCEVKLDQFTQYMQQNIDVANFKIKELEKTIEWLRKER